MKFWIWANLTAIVVGLASAIAFAGEGADVNYEGRLLRRREEQSRQSRADELRFERARYRARERIAQEERYERMNYSPLRPTTPLWSMSLGNYGGPLPYQARPYYP